MPELYNITKTVISGQALISDPALFGSNVVHVCRNGIAYTQMLPTEGFSGNAKEYSYKKTGIFAYKILFNSSVDPLDAGDVHIIYSI